MLIAHRVRAGDPRVVPVHTRDVPGPGDDIHHHHRQLRCGMDNPRLRDDMLRGLAPLRGGHRGLHDRRVLSCGIGAEGHLLPGAPLHGGGIPTSDPSALQLVVPLRAFRRGIGGRHGHTDPQAPVFSSIVPIYIFFSLA